MNNFNSLTTYAISQGWRTRFDLNQNLWYTIKEKKILGKGLTFLDSICDAIKKS